MLNLKKTNNKDEIKRSIQARGKDLDVDLLFDLYDQYKNALKATEDNNQLINKAAENRDIPLGKELKIQSEILYNQLSLIESRYKEYLLLFPNIVHHSVPIGKDESENIIIKQEGDIIFHKHHYDMGITHECVNFTGSRFVLLKAEFASLERGLLNFMMDHLLENGFTEYSIPYIMNSNGFLGSGHLPKDQDNMFKVEEDQYLIPTGEAVLVNLARNKKFNTLPMKVATVSDCFRKEAGSAGKDTKGLIRVHQFKKCEMVCFTEPDQSYEMLEEMLDISVNLIKKLNIPYCIESICSGDMGAVSAKQYDIKVPIGNEMREIASISNCEDFQSINLSAKNSKNEFIHMLNGSAVAAGRLLATLLEVHYDPNTRMVILPDVLKKYVPFQKILIST